MKSSTTAAGLPLANAPAGSRKLLTQHRGAIVGAQEKVAPLLARRSEYETKRAEILEQLEQAGEPDAIDSAAVERDAARKRQLSLLESSITALDPQVEAGERMQRVALIDARNLAARPILEPEGDTVFQEVVKGVRPWCHSDGEAVNFARQLPVLGDYELWAGLPWVEIVPLEEATTRMLAILDALADGRLPFTFQNGL